MLSRTANDLYWTGRHIERADNTARLLDTTYHTQIGRAPARERVYNSA